MERENRSLLIVDRSASHLFFMGTMLRNLEYAVRGAASADEALRALIATRPALVIADTALPDRSGIDLLKQMKLDSRLSSIPVIIHSSEEDPDVRKHCLEAGCADFYRKPTDFEVLYRAIQAATETSPRRNIRIEIQLDVEVCGEGGAARRETATALSEGGLYIRSLAPEPVQAALMLRIFFQNGEVRAKAVVQYSSTMIGGRHKEPGMGLMFTNIRPEDKTYIREFIQAQITRGFPV